MSFTLYVVPENQLEHFARELMSDKTDDVFLMHKHTLAASLMENPDLRVVIAPSLKDNPSAPMWGFDIARMADRVIVAKCVKDRNLPTEGD
jgi:hypothetical protein